MKAKSLSLPVLTEEEMTEIMEESLIISKETVKKAAFYVEYSDNIVTIMHEAQHPPVVSREGDHGHIGGRLVQQENVRYEQPPWVG